MAMMDWKLVRQKRTKVCFVQKQSEAPLASETKASRSLQAARSVGETVRFRNKTFHAFGN